MNRRLKTLELIPKFKKGLEIGVWKGEFSQYLLELTEPEKLFLLDPWLFLSKSEDGEKDYSDRWYGGSHAKSQNDMDTIYEQVKERFVEHHNVSIIRDYSQNIFKYLEPSSLDWCYIDGNHSYEFVLQDLELCLRLSNKEAIIIGDDYDNSEEVRSAVSDFVSKNKSFISETFLIEGQFVIKVSK